MPRKRRGPATVCSELRRPAGTFIHMRFTAPQCPTARCRHTYYHPTSPPFAVAPPVSVRRGCVCSASEMQTIDLFLVSGVGTKPTFKRLARRGGVKRISMFMYEELRGCLFPYIQGLLRDTMLHTKHDYRYVAHSLRILWQLSHCRVQKDDGHRGRCPCASTVWKDPLWICDIGSYDFIGFSYDIPGV